MGNEPTPSRAAGDAVAASLDALAGHLELDASALRLESRERTVGSDGTVRSTTHWAAAGTTWRVVVDSAAGGPDDEPGQSSRRSPPDRRHTVVEVADTRAAGRGATGWDTVHDPGRGDDHLGPRDVNPSVAQAVTPLDPGSALDIACGTGRHALWLAERGWQVTGLDFSRAALAVAAAEAERRRVDVRWLLGDARVWTPPQDGYDLVVMAFVHLPSVLPRAARWLHPGGRLVVVGHAVRNATQGTGGPRDPRLLHDVVDLAARVTGARLRVLVAREVERRVDGGVAVDAVLVATRLASPG